MQTTGEEVLEKHRIWEEGQGKLCRMEKRLGRSRMWLMSPDSIKGCVGRQEVTGQARGLGW